ncbi:hypothetical protein CYMTET_20957 [Cymbomonas tetramitiformis]|uniref:Reverse transcriptase domain-containing protein n=1 Tax=Cymbomonas tetramitiformis TaxID=36881 RepID=A0AAE0G331_9CHLO|nr:hypothetical protein CYMTET_20957 [Cymbomonas tetramitiformis]
MSNRGFIRGTRRAVRARADGETLEVPEADLWVLCEEAHQVLGQYRQAAMWGGARAVATVEKLMVLSQPSRVTTKEEMLEERAGILLEFEVLGPALGDVPEELEGQTEDLVEAWAAAAKEFQETLPEGSPVASLGGRRGGGARSPGGISQERLEEIVAKAVAQAVAGFQQTMQAGDPQGQQRQGQQQQQQGRQQNGQQQQQGQQQQGRQQNGQQQRGRQQRGLQKGSRRDVAKESLGSKEAWTWSECQRVILEIKVAAARQDGDLMRVDHKFGKHPARLVEAEAMEEVVGRFPECAERQCGLEDLPEEEGVRVRHLYGYVELAVKQLKRMQRALEGVAGAEQRSFSDDWLIEAARGKRERQGKGKKREASQRRGQGSDEDEEEQEAARKRFKDLRTATEEELSRALEGTLDVKDILKPPEGIAVVNEKAKHCRSWEEWDEAFTMLMCAAPAEARDLLAGFRKWMRVLAGEFAWEPLRKFYDHLVSRMAKDPSVTFELASYSALWELYRLEKGVKAKPAGATSGGGTGTGGRSGGARKPWTGVADAGKGKDAGNRGAGAKQAGGGAGKQGKGALRAPGCGEEEVSDVGSREPVPTEEISGGAQESGERWEEPGQVQEAHLGSEGGGGEYPSAGGSSSRRWPELREDIVRRATLMGPRGSGTEEGERLQFQQEVRRVGAQVPLMSERAHLMAAVFQDWPDMEFLVRGAACGVGFPFEGQMPEEPYVVPNYVGEGHGEAMSAEITKELGAGRIFMADHVRPWGVSALGMVERIRKGKLKYRPVWDYSRPAEIAASGGTYWAAQCFQWGGTRYMDTRSPFGNRALPGIFMRYTRAIVGWMQAQGVPCVGYLDDFLMVARSAEEARECMDLLVEFVTMLGFKVNRAKCEGPAQVMEFLGVRLSTEGERCTASIDEERVQQVSSKLQEVRAAAMVGPVSRKELESLLGLLAFCSQVVWGLSLYTRQGFALVAATVGRARIAIGTGVQQDLKAVETIIRLYNGRNVVLHREDVEDAFATDASHTRGMGGHCGQEYFLIVWDDLKEMQQLDFYPFTTEEKSHINYLERFAVWWALALWAHRLEGWTLVVRIDNQCALRHVEKFWGPV